MRGSMDQFMVLLVAADAPRTVPHRRETHSLIPRQTIVQRERSRTLVQSYGLTAALLFTTVLP